jgi:hypothetical protein
MKKVLLVPIPENNLFYYVLSMRICRESEKNIRRKYRCDSWAEAGIALAALTKDIKEHAYESISLVGPSSGF